MTINQCDFTPEEADSLAEMLKGVAHPLRLRLLSHLSQSPCTVTQLCVLTNAAQNLVSQHLARLRHLGLVKAVRQGGTATYSLGKEELRTMLDCVCRCR